MSSLCTRFPGVGIVCCDDLLFLVLSSTRKTFREERTICRPTDDGTILASISSGPGNVLSTIKSAVFEWVGMLISTSTILISLLTDKTGAATENKQAIDGANVDVFLWLFPASNGY